MDMVFLFFMTGLKNVETNKILSVLVCSCIIISALLRH